MRAWRAACVDGRHSAARRRRAFAPPLRRWVRVFLEYSSSVTPPLTSGEKPRAERAPPPAAGFAGGLKSSLPSLPEAGAGRAGGGRSRGQCRRAAAAPASARRGCTTCNRCARQTSAALTRAAPTSPRRRTPAPSGRSCRAWPQCGAVPCAAGARCCRAFKDAVVVAARDSEFFFKIVHTRGSKGSISGVPWPRTLSRRRRHRR